MAYFDHDGQREYIFGRGGGRQLAERLGVKFFGEIPLIVAIREGADSGKPVALEGTPEQVKLFETLAKEVDATAS
jgi:ATP-binding protein involved in chromosome partitioning